MAITSHKDLVVWQKSVDLVEILYDYVSDFPKEEKYGLQSQMKDSVVSIPSNIAEGRRRGSKKDFRRFLLISFGSGAELETQLEISRRLSFGDEEKRKQAEELLEEIMKMLNVMIERLKP